MADCFGALCPVPAPYRNRSPGMFPALLSSKEQAPCQSTRFHPKKSALETVPGDIAVISGLFVFPFRYFSPM